MENLTTSEILMIALIFAFLVIDIFAFFAIKKWINLKFRRIESDILDLQWENKILEIGHENMKKYIKEWKGWFKDMSGTMQDIIGVVKDITKQIDRSDELYRDFAEILEQVNRTQSTDQVGKNIAEAFKIAADLKDEPKIETIKIDPDATADEIAEAIRNSLKEQIKDQTETETNQTQPPGHKTLEKFKNDEAFRLRWDAFIDFLKNQDHLVWHEEEENIFGEYFADTDTPTAIGIILWFMRAVKAGQNRTSKLFSRGVMEFVISKDLEDLGLIRRWHEYTKDVHDLFKDENGKYNLNAEVDAFTTLYDFIEFFDSYAGVFAILDDAIETGEKIDFDDFKKSHEEYKRSIKTNIPVEDKNEKHNETPGEPSYDDLIKTIDGIIKGFRSRSQYIRKAVENDLVKQVVGKLNDLTPSAPPIFRRKIYASTKNYIKYKLDALGRTVSNHEARLMARHIVKNIYSKSQESAKNS